MKTRRILALVLAMVMLLSMAACAKKQPAASQAAPSMQTAQKDELPAQTPAKQETQQKPAAQQPAPEQSVVQQTTQTTQQGITAQTTVEKPLPVDDTDRESLEEIVTMLSKDAVSEGDMDVLDDEQLEQLVTDLLEQGTVQEAPDTNQPSVERKEEVYDEDGAMTVPFDQAYPELIEQGKVEFEDETLLVKLESDTITADMAAAGVGQLEELVVMSESTWYEAKLVAGTDVKAALEALRALDEVLLVEYNYQIQTAAIDGYKPYPGGKDLGGNKHEKDQWHMHHCGIPDGMSNMKNDGGSPSVVVAVIDTGVDYDHEDLAQNIWVNEDEIPDNGYDDDQNGYVDDYYGVDIVSGTGNGDDDNGHGTHVAGIIAAQNNNLGTVGIAYNTKIMPVKAAMASGVLNQSDIARAITYAYENGAEVINMSFGGTACSIMVQDALAVAYTRCVLVASAGNDGANNEGLFAIPNYPAALTYVLGVMSVDSTGRESAFTNWDVTAFNGVEYELYAPGDAIMSTLPDDRYGILSGTSMAAPVVSAMAAILRSEFDNRDMYPTKFIYGQLASTSDYNATCLNPDLHGLHNLPQIVDLNAALTKLPKPEVSMQDYALFDTKGLEQDTDGKNTGEGAIDAGETIALGMTLRNRWGMSKNTLVKIDTLSMVGIPDPYITIINDTVDYGSVGTYSTQDCGRIYTDELLTGWEDPFYIKIADNCPNDYIFRLNVTVTCENALDEKDTAVYEKTSTIMLEVRNGTVLPKIISEDMVLTKDNLYIIADATIIEKGATVTVEPGTKIQFWSNDEDDPYASNYIPYLRVEGKFLVNGTKEEPVQIFPSDLRWNYAVILGEYNGGTIQLRYADITNYGVPHQINVNGMTSVYGCVFRNSTNIDDIYYRFLSEGKVHTSNTVNYYKNLGKVENTAFYKIGGKYNTLYLQGGYFNRCIFVDCAMNLSSGNSFQNCVFQGNTFKATSQWGDEYINSSSMVISDRNYLGLLPENAAVHYWPETGTTYIALNGSSEEEVLYMQELGGNYAVIETAEERLWLANNLPNYARFPGDGNSYYERYALYELGIQYNWQEGAYVWADGTPVTTLELPEEVTTNEMNRDLYFDRGSLVSYTTHMGHNDSCYNHAYLYLYEFPGPIYLTDFTMPEYEILLDMESTYQMSVSSKPVNVEPEELIFQSRNKAVAAVDEQGLITPVAPGVTYVYVYSQDMALSNYVTVTVKDYVALESIAFPMDYTEMAVGEEISVSCMLTPADTTRRNLTYSSSNPEVATVDKYGHVKALSSGEALITATSKELDQEGQPITAQLSIVVYQRATSLDLNVVAAAFALEEDLVDLPEVVTSAGAETMLTWRSVDTDVAEVEDGKLKLKKTGTTTLEVTDQRSGLKATCLIMVQNEKPAAIKKMAVVGSCHYALLEDGRLYYWDHYNHKAPYHMTGVVDFAESSDSALILRENGALEFWYFYGSNPHCYDSNNSKGTTNAFVGREVQSIAMVGHNSEFFCIVDGNAYAWGNNNYGNLGLGFTDSVPEPSLVNLDNVVQIATCDNVTTYFLTANGDLYYAGGYESVNTSTPKRIGQNVVRIIGNNTSSDSAHVETTDGRCGRMYTNGDTSLYSYYGLDQMDYFTLYGSSALGIRDGKVYYWNSSSQNPKEIPGIYNAVDVYIYSSTCYVMTEDNLLMAFGSNGMDYNHMLGMTTENPVEKPVILPLQGLTSETVTLVETNLDVENVLVGNTLELTFNKHILKQTPRLYADGSQITLNSEIQDLNKVLITRSAGFQEGVNYELVFLVDTLEAEAGVKNTSEIRLNFTYVFSEEELPDEIIGGGDTEEKLPVVHTARLDESIERFYWTSQYLADEIARLHSELNWNPDFLGNALLNRISTDTEVEHWLRLRGYEANSKDVVPLGGNYWGSTNDRAIGLQIIDYTDFPNYAQLDYAPFLAEAPEDTFPFVTSVKIFDKDGKEITTVGNQEVTFRVTFNRDMDTSIPLTFRYGSAYPYGDYEVFGEYVDARTWEGKYTLTTVIENGYHYFTISDGRAAGTDLDLWTERARFFFELDTTAAQALLMQGSATNEGIELTWSQDDFDTLMGYNIYRSESEDGYYQRVNDTVVPADVKEYFDDSVEPGKIYYYNFTVVKTDLTESIPSGKIIIMSKDTMAPNVYHTPVTTATTGSNLVISATVTDNLGIQTATVYYRTVGASTWNTAVMNSLNDKYTAIIPANHITTDGLEYYIEAFDGNSYTYKGNASTPHKVTIRQALDASSKGDVNGDGVISNLDALMLLQAINDLLNLNADQFDRADLDSSGNLTPAEALRILQYVSGSVGSLTM